MKVLISKWMRARSGVRMVVLASALSCAVASVPAMASTPIRAFDGDPPLDVAAAAAEIGITPESIVIAGLEGSTQLILARIEAADSLVQGLASLRASEDAASSAVCELAAAVQMDPADTNIIGQYQSAVAQLESVRTQIESIRQSLRDEALADIPAAQVASLQTWRSAAALRVPAELRVLTRTAEQWSLIEIAVRAEARAQARNETLEEPHATLLNSVRSEVAVVQAAQRLAANLATVEQWFAEAAGGGES